MGLYRDWSVRYCMRLEITEEMNIHEEWYADAENQTMDTLLPFLNHLMNDYNHDYGTIVHALIAGTAI